MSKYLKHYNIETGEWELISAPDVSVIQQLASGADITDTNVIVTNYQYSESGETTLNNTLEVIGNDIAKLKSNVSWLAEHGGGGSGSGTGTTSSYGIVIDSPVIENGRAYITGTKLDVEFMITGGSSGDICKYAYQFDSESLTDYTEITVNTTIKLSWELSASTLSSHSLIIKAINPYGNNIASKSFNIYLSSLKLVFDEDTAGESYKDGVFNVSLNASHAYIPLIMTNGLEGADITIIAKRGSDAQTSLTLKSVSAGTSKRQIDFWNLFPSSSPETGTYYVITIDSSSVISGTKAAESEQITLRIKVINPNQLTISLGLNGIDTSEAVEVPLESTLNYSFKTYAPTSISRVYYSAKINNGTNDYLILGKYFSDDLHESGITSYTSNDNIETERTISSQYYISESIFTLGTTCSLEVKVWDYNGTQTTSITKTITIVKASNDIYPRQIQKRDDSSTTGDTMFASWNRTNANATLKTTWKSEINCYDFLSSELKESKISSVTLNMNVLNGNSESQIKTDSVPYLRLQNHAYATIDFSEYRKELDIITRSSYQYNDGFTVSLSVYADKHNDTNHTLFLWGQNSDNDGSLIKGMRVDVDKIYWYIIEKSSGGQTATHKLKCNFTCEERTSIDFSFTKGTSSVPSTARIYVNGVLNAAVNLEDIDDSYTLPNLAYFGVNYYNSACYNFSDLNIYEFSIYSKTLNDMQIAINGKNSRLLGKDSEETVIEDYKNWKIKNFITSDSETPTIPKSNFFINGSYQEDFDSALIQNISSESSIPVLSIHFDDDSKFTSSLFYEKSTDTSTTYDCKATYYISGNSISFKSKVALQGTSTLGYRIKNLEFYIAEQSTVVGFEDKTKLFQPKKEWMPEGQFTLKADVVDSSHANNAVLGNWINECTLLENNPAMANFTNENRPLDIDDNGTVHTHTKAGSTEEINYDENVTIKHTLEGFPILLFLRFGGTSAKSTYTFIGIYSFNLGRNSYYNMGLKFLKSFSRRSSTYPEIRNACPCLINYYEEKDTLGEINKNNIYSFELGNKGNLQVSDYPVWSQYDTTVVKSYGSFRFSPDGSVSDTIWSNLCSLFEAAAKCPVDSYYGDVYTGFNNKYYYTYNSTDDKYHPTSTIIDQSSDYYSILMEKLNINNAAVYFVIANAFGMTDSLGKNLTLRTWNGGSTWWPCFYDMDTALGLSNDGSEDNPITVSIDKVQLSSDKTTKKTVLSTTYHESTSKYAAYLSKLWGILRCNGFLYAASKTTNPYYEEVWSKLRQSGGKLSSSSNFTTLMENRIGTCGEIIYNFDYTSKYIQDTNEQEEGTPAAIDFLHGTRISYVKDWLTKHFYYLDGMFDKNRLTITYTYEDSPYYKDIFTIACLYDNTITDIAFKIKVTTPAFLGFTVGNDEYRKFYIEESNKETLIYLSNGTSSNSQLAIKGASLLYEIDGLQSAFQKFMTNENGVTKSLSTFDISNSTNMVNDPFKTESFIENNKSSLETLKLTNTHGATVSTYSVDLEEFDKILNIDISNSDVTSLKLPSSALETLKINNSNITEITLKNQDKLSSIDFTGCNKLTTITINNCNGLSNLSIIEKDELYSLIVMDCSSLETIVISGNSALNTITISNCNNLKSITIDNCTNKNLSISINGNTPLLEKISISNLGINNENVINFPNSTSLSNVTSFTISSCYKIKGWKFNDKEIETYNEENVFDLSYFTNLEGDNTRLYYLDNLKYLRVLNNELLPFGLYNSNNKNTIQQCNYLTRIFGHISIEESGIFNGFSNFELGSSYTPTSNDDVPSFSTDTHATNVTISTSDLTSTFAGTHCTINDAYYILHKCNSGTTCIESLFNNCSNIIVYNSNKLSEFVFGRCTNVNNIDYIFNGCSINGFIEQGVLQPLILNLTSFKNIFSGDYWIHAVQAEESVFPENNIIEAISGFNPKAYNDNGTYETYFRDTKLLNNLAEIKVIDNSFNDCQIDFTHGIYDSTELFKYNTELLEINNSFNIKYGYGSLNNIFGGTSDDTNYYPRKLESVINSFIIKNGDHNSYELYDGDDGAGLLLPIGNSFIKNISSTITKISGTNDKVSFSGDGILKYIPNFNYSSFTDDCSGKSFPYEVLKDCTKLEEIPSLFEKIKNFSRDEDSNFTTIDIQLPENIFNEALNLKNISHFFTDMGDRINVTLTSNGFKNNKITNANYIFAKNGYEGYDFKIKGQVPYKLFYEEISGLTSSVSGMTLNDVIQNGISINTANTYASLENLSEISIGDEYIIFNDETDSNKIAKYKCTAISGETITWEKQSLDDTFATLESPTHTTSYEGETYTSITSTFKNLEGCLQGLNSSAMSAYTATISTWEDLVEDNEKYNPILLINKSGNDWKINPNCSIFKKKWNKYIFDNSSNFYSYISSTGILNQKDSYGHKIVNEDLMPEEFKEGYVQNIQYEYLDKYSLGEENAYGYMTQEYVDKWKILITTNYICAPDIFRYCNSDPNINNSFRNSNSDINYIKDDKIFYINGIRGTIPSFIFEPLSEIRELTNVFEGCYSLFPYKWHEIETGGEETCGIMYPKELFKNNTYLTNISSIFAHNRIWGRTEITSLFTTLKSLGNVSSIWYACKWIDKNYGESYTPLSSQLNVNIFVNNSNLYNVSSMLSNSNSYSIYKVISNIITTTNNPKLSNCYHFMYEAQSSEGSAPEFWKWTEKQLTQYKGAYYSSNKQYENFENYNAENFAKYVTNE